MIRLILLLAFLMVMACGALILLGILRWIAGPSAPKETNTVPETFRTIAFLILIVLMFGVTSGFLGAA